MWLIDITVADMFFSFNCGFMKFVFISSEDDEP